MLNQTSLIAKVIIILLEDINLYQNLEYLQFSSNDDELLIMLGIPIYIVLKHIYKHRLVFANRRSFNSNFMVSDNLDSQLDNNLPIDWDDNFFIGSPLKHL